MTVVVYVGSQFDVDMVVEVVCIYDDVVVRVVYVGI